MPLLHIAILSLVQGITEFLPISSSGHLVLVPFVAHWKDQGLIVDVAVHVGTLGAVMLYLWRDIWFMIKGALEMIANRTVTPGGRLAMLVIAATIPVVIFGFAMNHYYKDGLRSVTVIGWTTLVYGVILYIADKVGLTMRRMEHLRFADAITIGLAQVLALIPGTSRSGITMTAARMLGMERTESARFSMILSVPTIIGAGLLKGLDLYHSGNAALDATVAIAVGLSFVSALVVIVLLMSWLKRATFTPFVIYRIALGGFLLAWAYGFIAPF
ncbi:undecaprenyl-diphosphate phosphatase [Varunaivibrio sulfuroxidans]|uniref:Undecaprenyl-diphosphatase n=1 Tax=Varunaivibrio sulfuroxidans TaxID=1773489 RepID=A0A4V6NYH5_9PROT|nr:undecaprenyl-diphosphate phosphatase [Varunaivibrio sulfuroxidans]TCS61611.1 undecaprenyl-diphosphatase [Varunaivibrio sulfuroxidans]WES29514.1 undecaprenyl-diphosphate phosphatase [Varunaivibrio sulfuroxidans]